MGKRFINGICVFLLDGEERSTVDILREIDPCLWHKEPTSHAHVQKRLCIAGLLLDKLAKHFGIVVLVLSRRFWTNSVASS